MVTRNVTRLFVLAVLALLLMSARLSYADGPTPVGEVTEAAEAVVPNAIAPSERFTIRATELLALQVQESGDNEPYVVMGVIRPNADGSHRLDFFSTPVFSGVRNGDIRQMNQTLLDNLNVTRDVAIVAQVIEHDENPLNETIAEMQFRAKVHYTFAVVNGDTSLASLRAAVAKGFSEGLQATNQLFSGRDNDEAIGAPVILTVSATEMDNLVAGETRTRTATATGEGAQWRMTFTIRRNQ